MPRGHSLFDRVYRRLSGQSIEENGPVDVAGGEMLIKMLANGEACPDGENIRCLRVPREDVRHSSVEMMRNCALCDGAILRDKALRCGLCKCQYYCCLNCQKVAWKTHQEDCKKICALAKDTRKFFRRKTEAMQTVRRLLWGLNCKDGDRLDEKTWHNVANRRPERSMVAGHPDAPLTLLRETYVGEERKILVVYKSRATQECIDVALLSVEVLAKIFTDTVKRVSIGAHTEDFNAYERRRTIEYYLDLKRLVNSFKERKCRYEGGDPVQARGSPYSKQNRYLVVMGISGVTVLEEIGLIASTPGSCMVVEVMSKFGSGDSSVRIGQRPYQLFELHNLNRNLSGELARNEGARVAHLSGNPRDGKAAAFAFFGLLAKAFSVWYNCAVSPDAAVLNKRISGDDLIKNLKIANVPLKIICRAEKMVAWTGKYLIKKMRKAFGAWRGWFNDQFKMVPVEGEVWRIRKSAILHMAPRVWTSEELEAERKFEGERMMRDKKKYQVRRQVLRAWRKATEELREIRGNESLKMFEEVIIQTDVMRAWHEVASREADLSLLVKKAVGLVENAYRIKFEWPSEYSNNMKLWHDGVMHQKFLHKTFNKWRWVTADERAPAARGCGPFVFKGR